MEKVHLEEAAAMLEDVQLEEAAPVEAAVVTVIRSLCMKC